MYSICVENYKLTESARNAIEYLMSNSELYLTLDIAKLFTSDNQIIREDYEFFAKHKNRIREIHIHDRNREFGSHQTVGTGDIDFKILDEFINDNIYLNFEVRPVEEAKISKDKIKKILE